MRSVVGFYRARPALGVLVFVLGLAVAVGTTALHDGGGIILPIAFVAAVGLVVGAAVAFTQRERS